MCRRVLLNITAPAVLALVAPVLALADAGSFRVRKDGGSRVTFVSDAPLETITGVSSQVSGEIVFDRDNLAEVRGKIEVPVASLRTGIDLRDEHLRGDKWLDAQKHPKASFEILSVEGARRLRPNTSTRVKVKGRFTVHGVTRNVTANARVRLIPLTDEIQNAPGIDGDVLRVQAKFKIELEDYGVSVPAIVRLKVSNEIEINVNLRAIAKPTEAPQPSDE